MVAVGYWLMAAAGTVNMVRIMTAAVVLRRAGLRISFRNFDGMFIDMALMWMMEMPIVQIIDVVAVLHASMPAVWAVFVLMVWMGLTLIFSVTHDVLLITQLFIGGRFFSMLDGIS